VLTRLERVREPLPNLLVGSTSKDDLAKPAPRSNMTRGGLVHSDATRHQLNERILHGSTLALDLGGRLVAQVDEGRHRVLSDGNLRRHQPGARGEERLHSLRFLGTQPLDLEVALKLFKLAAARSGTIGVHPTLIRSHVPRNQHVVVLSRE
jgi:hypothetical protein